MAVPKADFTFTLSGLVATFTDLSSPEGSAITAWAWNFGDGQTASTQNPSHTYSSAGTYIVTLTVTNADGTDNRALTILVSTSSTSMGLSISALISYKVPEDQVGLSTIEALKKKWMVMFASAAGVTDSPYDESNWPDAWIPFLADLVVYEIYRDTISNLAFTGGATSSSTSSSGASDGGVKAVETGPSKVEFYEANSPETSANVYKAVLSTNPGMMDELKEMLCQWAGFLKVHLYFCRRNKNTMLYKKAQKNPSVLFRNRK